MNFFNTTKQSFRNRATDHCEDTSLADKDLSPLNKRERFAILFVLPLLLVLLSCEDWTNKSKRTCALVTAGQINDAEAMKRLKMQTIEGKWSDEVTVSNYCHYYQ